MTSKRHPEALKLSEANFQRCSIVSLSLYLTPTPPLYAIAICCQNAFLADSCVIPLQGINEDLMYYLEETILCLQGTEGALHHKHTQ